MLRASKLRVVVLLVVLVWIVVSIALIGDKSIEGLEAQVKMVRTGRQAPQRCHEEGKLCVEGGMTMGVPLSWYKRWRVGKAGGDRCVSLVL